MSERRTARRYDLSLPVIIRIPVEDTLGNKSGKTRDISTRGVYFTIDERVEAGSELDITLTLPAEITQGTEVFVRAQGKVVRVEKRSGENDEGLGVAAVIERYDIVRGERAARAS
jgi:PilZ domain-containing protein